MTCDRTLTCPMFKERRCNGRLPSDIYCSIRDMDEINRPPTDKDIQEIRDFDKRQLARSFEKMTKTAKLKAILNYSLKRPLDDKLHAEAMKLAEELGLK